MKVWALAGNADIAAGVAMLAVEWASPQELEWQELEWLVLESGCVLAVLLSDSQSTKALPSLTWPSSSLVTHNPVCRRPPNRTLACQSP
jgi:hypothetical protein